MKRQILASLHKSRVIIATLGLLWLLVGVSEAASTLIEICPQGGIQAWTAGFEPGGIILASFDSASLWVYDVDRNSRYPLPDTHPCGSNCRLSQDASWITYVDDSTYYKMRLDGTERTSLSSYASDVEWWSDDTMLVWTPGHDAYLQRTDSQEREYLNVTGVFSVQPGGRWGLLTEQSGDSFTRSLLNLETRDLEGIAQQQINLGDDSPYFNAASWSPDGQWLAYIAPGAFDSQANVTGGEVFGIRPGDSQATQWTDLTGNYGAVRINGRATGELSWSPDGRQIAFWVIELLGSDPEGNTGNAVIHILDITSGEIGVYCGYSTTEHTPNPPRLIWSPDSTHLAFGGNVPADDKGYLLLALDTTTGIFTELSNGLFPALGTADPVAWGLRP
jgi:Tol biopolymer transport system component